MKELAVEIAKKALIAVAAAVAGEIAKSEVRKIQKATEKVEIEELEPEK